MEFKYRAVDAPPPAIQAGSSGSYHTGIHVSEAIQIEKIKIREEIMALQREMEKQHIHEEIITAETIRRRELVAEVMREMATERDMAMGMWKYPNPNPIPIPLPPAEDLRFKHQLSSFNLLTARDTHTSNKPPLVALDKTEPSADKLSSLGLNKRPKGEWSCGLCRISAPDERALKQHFQGKKHRAEKAASRVENMTKKPGNSKFLRSKEEWNCALCQINAPNEGALAEHFFGKKHKAEEAAMGTENTAMRADTSKLTSNIESSCTPCQVSALNERPLKEPVQIKKHIAKEALGAENMGKEVDSSKWTKNKEEWSCAVCLISAPNEGALYEHFRGKKHIANKAALRIKIMGNKADISTRHKEWIPGPCQIGAKEAPRTENMAKKSDNSKGGQGKEDWRCALCHISAPNQGALNEHFQGKKHKANEAVLRIKNARKRVNMPKLTRNKEWRCALCQVSAPNEGAFNEHILGKKHRASEVASQTESLIEKFKTTNLTNNKDVWTCAPNEKPTDKRVPGNKIETQEASLRTENMAKMTRSSKWAEKSSPERSDSKQACDMDQVDRTAGFKNQCNFQDEICSIGIYSEDVMENHLVGEFHKAWLPVESDFSITSDTTTNTTMESKPSAITSDQLKTGKDSKLKDVAPEEAKMEGQTVEEAAKEDPPAKEARREDLIAKVNLVKSTASDATVNHPAQEEIRVDEDKVKMAPGNTVELSFWKKLYSVATLPKVVMDIMSKNQQTKIQGQTEQSEA